MEKQYWWKAAVIKRLQQLNGRNLIFIGKDSFSYEILQTLRYLQYKIDKIIDLSDNGILKLNYINQLNDLDHLDLQSFVLVAQCWGHREVYEKLLKCGFKYKTDMELMNLGGYLQEIDSIDAMLGYSRKEQIFDGIKIYGDLASKKKKIAILGNSTSDPYTCAIKSWPELLYEKTCNEIILINAAMTGYSTGQELVKLCRDILSLKPDVVISFSGYNDFNSNSFIQNHPFIHKYQKRFFDFISNNKKLAPDSMDMRNISNITFGVENRDADYEIWLNNIRLMNAVCKEMSIRFIGCLQPMRFSTQDKLTPDLETIYTDFFGQNEYQQYKKDMHFFCNILKDKILNYEYIFDLSRLFEGRDDLFYDPCHCTEIGNEIISNTIKNIIGG